MKKIPKKNKLIYIIIFIIIILSLIYFSNKLLQKKALHHIITNPNIEMYIDENGVWLYPIEGTIPSDKNIRFKTMVDKKHMKYEDALIVSENNNKIIYAVSKLDDVDQGEVLKPNEVSAMKDLHKDIIKKNRTIHIYQIDKNFFYDLYWKYRAGKIINFDLK